jgi:superfamily II DNA or RNA helicase
MLARVDAAIRIARGQVPAKLEERLRRALSFPNPAYLDRLRLGLSAHGIPERLCFVEADADALRLPRGAIHTLRRLAALDGEIVRCEDCRVLPAERLPELPLPPLRPYQERAVEVMVKRTQGTVVVPCGGGKTRIALGALARLRTPALILVHTLDLAEQWRRELRQVLGVEAGLVGGGEVAPAAVTVALVQALATWEAAKLEAFLAGFGVLVLDEAHHCQSTTFRAIVDRSPARYRFGLTATPEREDGLTALLDLYLGPAVASVTHEELVAAGVLKLPEVRPVETAFTFPYAGADDYARLLDALVRDDGRNALIADLVAAEARAGHLSLVLSGRVEHCEALCRLVRERGVEAELLTGAVKKERRTELLDGARAGRVRVLVATTLADEGLDLPALARVFLAYPGRARGRTLQRLGRLMRTHPGKADAILFDFVDRRVPVLRRHHVERRQLYTEVLGIRSTAGAA